MYKNVFVFECIYIFFSVFVFWDYKICTVFMIQAYCHYMRIIEINTEKVTKAEGMS